MDSRALFVLSVLWLVLGRTKGSEQPCFAAERVSSYERRFFSFVPANVRSEPPIECAFVFGSPPGSRLRMSAYDVRTRGDPGDANECRGDALRVYDVGRRGLQLMATYCGLLRQGKILTMSSNMAVVTFTTDGIAMENAFSLVIYAVKRDIPQKNPCQNPVTETNRETSVSHENATLTTIFSTTQIPEYLSTTEFSREGQSTSESAEKEVNASAPEENQNLGVSTTNRNFTTNESESNESESQEKTTEFFNPEEMVDDEAQLEY